MTRRTLHPNAIDALIVAARDIKASPKEFSMNTWVCKTSACIGGRLCLQYYGLDLVRAFDVSAEDAPGLVYGDEMGVALAVLHQILYTRSSLENTSSVSAYWDALYKFDDLFFHGAWHEPWKTQFFEVEGFNRLRATIASEYVLAYARAHVDPDDRLPDALRDIDASAIPAPTASYKDGLKALKGTDTP